MKYKELEKACTYIILDEEDDKETPPAAGEDPQAELDTKIAEKIATIGEIASKELDDTIKNKSDIFIKKIQNSSIDDVLLNFVTQKFIPNMQEVDDKLFVTVNLDDFIECLSAKFSEKLIGKIDDVVKPKTSDKEDKKDKEDKEEK